MSSDAEAAPPDDSRTEAAERIAELKARIEELEDEVATAAVAERDDEKSMVIIATQGTLDMAYPPLTLASTAAAFDWDVTVFHTFWGLDILHEERAADLQLSAVGNPNMSVPNAIAALPGMDRLATIRWHDGEPVGDGHLKGQFRALKDIVGDMVDKGVFTQSTARQYLTQKPGEWVGKRQELLIPNSPHNPVRPD